MNRNEYKEEIKAIETNKTVPRVHKMLKNVDAISGVLKGKVLTGTCCGMRE